ncbi:TetR/AcrR family transcriptional regulator [Frigidibacter sp. ROC022]|uniref:TetR/AcrR family transcriptional regulator n=1 Tax=Frigidibacter sp. ROC022 TaxID=2971796 RepID=UPI00215B237B|nr:TetR/AcrR family transcriptional regulator [Frigidibacter sp. ROC022]MCR8725019.1 TetR/AcrR family transcriptional regulator [Frigidibacter sp. ROC022]
MSLKRDPDSDRGTVRRILDTAEALFAEHGLQDTSIRQITQAAEVNLASVNYHFGSKENLAEAVFERAVARVTEKRRRDLAGVLAEARERGERPELTAIVSTFVEPYLGDGNDAQGTLMARFILLHRLSPSEATQRIVKTHLNPLAADYIAAFSLACPEIPANEMTWRYLLMASTVVLTATEDRSRDRIATLSRGKRSISDRAATRDALVRFVVGGIVAPVQGGFRPFPEP